MDNLRNIFKSLLYIASLSLIAFTVILVPTWILQNFASILGALAFQIISIIFGIIVVLYTFVHHEKDTDSIWQKLSRLSHFELVGYVYGFVLIAVPILWFFLPQNVTSTLPYFPYFLGYFILSVPLLYVFGEALSEGIIDLINRKITGIVYCLIALSFFCVINLPIWFYTESMPFSYYGFGKLFFVIIVILQILYVIFFHISPALHKSK